MHKLHYNVLRIRSYMNSYLEPLSQLTEEVLHNSCNTGTCGLPDMYILSPQASCVHIRQTI